MSYHALLCAMTGVHQVPSLCLLTVQKESSADYVSSYCHLCMCAARPYSVAATNSIVHVMCTNLETET